MSDSSEKKYFDFSVLKRVFTFVKPYRRKFIVSIVLAVVLSFFTPIRPFFIQLTIDEATGKNVHTPWIIQFLFPHTDLSNVWQFVIAVTIFQVIFIFIETAARFYFSFITTLRRSWLDCNRRYPNSVSLGKRRRKT